MPGLMKNAAYLLLLTVILGSCKKNLSDKDPFYFKGKINGQSVNWVVPFNDQKAKYAALLQTPGGGLVPAVYWCGSDRYEPGTEGAMIREYGAPNGANTIAVGFTKSFEPGEHSRALRSWFTNGPKSYGSTFISCTAPVVPGITISYTDATGKDWESSHGDRSSNYFEQISLEDELRIHTYYKKWKVKFSCKLYDTNGNYVTLTDCEFYSGVFGI